MPTTYAECVSRDLWQCAASICCLLTLLTCATCGPASFDLLAYASIVYVCQFLMANGPVGMLTSLCIAVCATLRNNSPCYCVQLDGTANLGVSWICSQHISLALFITETWRKLCCKYFGTPKCNSVSAIWRFWTLNATCLLKMNCNFSFGDEL